MKLKIEIVVSGPGLGLLIRSAAVAVGAAGEPRVGDRFPS